MAYGVGSANIYSAAEAKSRNTNSVMANWVDRGPWQYWDTITFPAAGKAAVNQTYNPFSVPIGAIDPLTSVPKTKLQTNMVRGNQFAPPRCLLLQAIGFYFSSAWVLADMTKILDACYMEFRIDDKIFHEGQLWEFPAGAGVTGSTGISTEEAWGLGLKAPFYQRRYGDWAKYIAPEQQFSMTINFGGGLVTIPSIGASTNTFYPGVLVVTLDGLTDRSVQ